MAMLFFVRDGGAAFTWSQFHPRKEHLFFGNTFESRRAGENTFPSASAPHRLILRRSLRAILCTGSLPSELLIEFGLVLLENE